MCSICLIVVEYVKMNVKHIKQIWKRDSTSVGSALVVPLVYTSYEYLVNLICSTISWYIHTLAAFYSLEMSYQSATCRCRGILRHKIMMSYVWISWKFCLFSIDSDYNPPINISVNLYFSFTFVCTSPFYLIKPSKIEFWCRMHKTI